MELTDTPPNKELQRTRFARRRTPAFGCLQAEMNVGDVMSDTTTLRAA